MTFSKHMLTTQICIYIIMFSIDICWRKHQATPSEQILIDCSIHQNPLHHKCSLMRVEEDEQARSKSNYSLTFELMNSNNCDNIISYSIFLLVLLGIVRLRKNNSLVYLPSKILDSKHRPQTQLHISNWHQRAMFGTYVVKTRNNWQLKSGNRDKKWNQTNEMTVTDIWVWFEHDYAVSGRSTC